MAAGQLVMVVVLVLVLVIRVVEACIPFLLCSDRIG
jgi:hypothetical protein